jgi:hypothetical protein
VNEKCLLNCEQAGGCVSCNPFKFQDTSGPLNFSTDCSNCVNILEELKEIKELVAKDLNLDKENTKLLEEIHKLQDTLGEINWHECNCAEHVNKFLKPKKK